MVQAQGAGAATQTREQIKDELVKKAKNYFDTFDQYNVVFEDAARNYVAR